jgi:hypothetical protein
MQKKTLYRSAWNHILISLVIVAIVPAIYYMLLGNLSDPDFLSPIVYLAAVITSVLMTIKARDSSSFSFYAVIPLFCALAFLEEVSYGVEIFNFQPYYWEKYNVYIRDLHGLAGRVYELVLIEIGGDDFNHELLANFIQKDLQILGISALTVVFARLHNAKSKLRENLALGIPAMLFLIGVLAILDMAALPTDPKNVLLLGYSTIRIMLMMSVLLLSVLPLAIMLRPNNSRIQKSFQPLANMFAKKRKVYYLVNVGLIILILGFLGYQFWILGSKAPWDEAIVDRISPLVFFGLGTAAILFVAIFSKLGWLSYPAISYVNGLKKFLTLHPSFIYMLISIGLIGIAQMVDKNWLFIFGIERSPNLLATDLSDWFEDGFELTAGVELIIAGLFIGWRRHNPD